MKITALFWNTWLDNHINSAQRRRRVEVRLEDLLAIHKPDVIGLNEVVVVSDEEPKILKILKEQDYRLEYLPNIPLPDGRKMGSVLASKHKYVNYREVDTGPNTLAAKNNFKGHRVKHLFADITTAEGDLFTFGVVHLLPLYPYAIPEHYRQQKSMAAAMNNPDLRQPVIVGGDFNEFKCMPIRSIRGLTKLNYHRTTGSYLNPTWTAYAIKWHPVRANYDQIYWSKDPKIKLLSSSVIREHPSDHAPIVATFQINN